MKVEKSLELFKEVITSENVEAMSEMIAICETKYLIGWVGQAMIDIHKNLMIDIYNKNKSDYVLTDSYDLVQEVAVLLCGNMGKRLSDTHHIDKKGKVITIQMQACKEITRLTNYKCRRMKTDYCIDAMSETELQTLEIDNSNNFEIEESYRIVENIISNLGLSETQLTVLKCRMNGMSYPQIAKIIQRAVGTTYDYLKTVQRRYTAIYG